MSGRRFAAFGALACGISVGLSALAMHAQDGHGRLQLGLAAALAFGHGLALVSIASRDSRLATFARWGFAAGIVAFSGSLAGAALQGWPTPLAPMGGMAMMLGWVILAADFLRRP